MSHKIHYLLLTFALLLIPAAVSAQDTPAFSVWLDCIERGPYAGMAQAHIGYKYDGQFSVVPEDNRLLGDTATGDTIVLPYPIEPGEHDKALVLNVGANKVVTLKIVLFAKLYVVTAWDNPEILDCPIELTPEATPEPVSNL